MAVKSIRDGELIGEVLSYKGVVLLEMWADWCVPCKQISPMLDRLSEEFKDVKFLRANVDESPEMVSRYQVRALPNILLFKDGSVIDQMVGVYSIGHIRKMIEENI